jgi:hypothetical protein
LCPRKFDWLVLPHVFLLVAVNPTIYYIEPFPIFIIGFITLPPYCFMVGILISPKKSPIYIWVNSNISLTWIQAIWRWFPLFFHDSRENSEVVIIYRGTGSSDRARPRSLCSSRRSMSSTTKPWSNVKKERGNHGK